MSSNSQSFRLPDTLEHWPWKRLLNPYLQEVKGDSSAWLKSFKTFEPRQQQRFDLCNFELLAGLTYSLVSKEHLRLGCDFNNFTYAIDEFADVLDKNSVQQQGDIVMDVLRKPNKARPQGEPVVGEIARHCSHTGSEDQDIKHVRNVKDYLALRRDTSGAAPALSILEFGLDLPQDVLRHPVVASLTEDAINLIAIVNDLNSYLMEQSRGLATHNLVTVVMHEFKLDHVGAMDWLEVHIKAVAKHFLENYARLPSWGEDIDGRLKRYIDGLGYWVRGNDAWSFESQRYFGARGPEIQQSRWVTLQPSSKGFAQV